MTYFERGVQISVTNWSYSLGRTFNLFGPQFSLLQNKVIGQNVSNDL